MLISGTLATTSCSCASLELSARAEPLIASPLFGCPLKYCEGRSRTRYRLPLPFDCLTSLQLALNYSTIYSTDLVPVASLRSPLPADHCHGGCAKRASHKAHSYAARRTSQNGRRSLLFGARRSVRLGPDGYTRLTTVMSLHNVRSRMHEPFEPRHLGRPPTHFPLQPSSPSISSMHFEVRVYS